MRFDPALAARDAFKRAERSGQLGQDWEQVVELEEVFSAGAGPEARAAYEALRQIGERYPDVPAFQEFLIFSTWQQAAEEARPVHFKIGAALCDRYLNRLAARADGPVLRQVREIRLSFRAALGLEEEDEFETE